MATDEGSTAGSDATTTPPPSSPRTGRRRRQPEPAVSAQAPVAEVQTEGPMAALAEEAAREESPLAQVIPPVSQEAVGQPAAERLPETPPASGEEAAELDEGANIARRERQRFAHGNALGALIERQFLSPGSPARSYSDLERRSGISREALSRYVTARPDRRRSPTIDTLVAIADAMHLSLDGVCRSAAASVRGTMLPDEEVLQTREEVVRSLLAGLSDDQFSAVVELLRQMRPAGAENM